MKSYQKQIITCNENRFCKNKIGAISRRISQ